MRYLMQPVDDVRSYDRLHVCNYHFHAMVLRGFEKSLRAALVTHRADARPARGRKSLMTLASASIPDSTLCVDERTAILFGAEG